MNSEEKVYYWTQITFPFSYNHSVRYLLDGGSIECVNCRLVGQSNRYDKAEDRLVLFDKYYLAEKMRRLFITDLDLDLNVLIKVVSELYRLELSEEMKLRKYEHLDLDKLTYFFLVKKELTSSQFNALKAKLSSLTTEDLTNEPA